MENSKLVESLLYQSEGTTVDFKCKQYAFDGATDDQKSELLKDILAFSNSWRQSDAYIVIGVQTVTGGRHSPVNVDQHFDDAQLQQFINSKTNRPIEMSYEVHIYEGSRIGLIRIAKQKRPFYSKKNYGKVEKERVYYRQGSSTAVAKPEDVARMGEDSTPPSRQFPEMVLQFADHETREQLGDSIHISSIAYAVPTRPLPDFSRSSTPSYLSTHYNEPNRDYLRQKEAFIRLKHLCRPIGFAIHNSSKVLAEQVRVEIKGSCTGGIQVLNELPDEPNTDTWMASIPLFRSPLLPSPMVSVESYGRQWTVTILFGDVQPKSTVRSDEPIYIGSSGLERLEPDVSVFANNLPEPQKVNLTVEFDIEARKEIDSGTLHLNLTRY